MRIFPFLPEACGQPRPARRARGAGDDGDGGLSDQQVVLGRCPAWMCRIGRLAVAAEVLEYPLANRCIFDARDHPQLPAAVSADLDVDRVN